MEEFVISGSRLSKPIEIKSTIYPTYDLLNHGSYDFVTKEKK